VDPPPDYVLPLRPSLPLAAAAAAAATSFEGSTPFYTMPESSTGPLEHEFVGFTKDLEDVTLKAEDYQVFSKLFTDVNEDELTNEEIQERKIAALLLKIKNGTPPIRRAALKQITERVREPIFHYFYKCFLVRRENSALDHCLIKFFL
jgi:splicing factor 3B subunit 1